MLIFLLKNIKASFFPKLMQGDIVFCLNCKFSVFRLIPILQNCQRKLLSLTFYLSSLNFLLKLLDVKFLI